MQWKEDAEEKPVPKEACGKQEKYLLSKPPEEVARKKAEPIHKAKSWRAAQDKE